MSTNVSMDDTYTVPDITNFQSLGHVSNMLAQLSPPPRNSPYVQAYEMKFSSDKNAYSASASNHLGDSSPVYSRQFSDGYHYFGWRPIPADSPHYYRRPIYREDARSLEPQNSEDENERTTQQEIVYGEHDTGYVIENGGQFEETGNALEGLARAYVEETDMEGEVEDDDEVSEPLPRRRNNKKRRPGRRGRNQRRRKPVVEQTSSGELGLAEAESEETALEDQRQFIRREDTPRARTTKLQGDEIRASSRNRGIEESNEGDSGKECTLPRQRNGRKRGKGKGRRNGKRNKNRRTEQTEGDFGNQDENPQENLAKIENQDTLRNDIQKIEAQKPPGEFDFGDFTESGSGPVTPEVLNGIVYPHFNPSGEAVGTTPLPPVSAVTPRQS